MTEDKQSKEQELEAKRLEIQEKKLQMVTDQQLDQQLNAAASQVTPPGTQTRKSKMVAALLAFFLGFIGIHKFYLNRGGAGILMLLLTVCTLGIGGIVTWLIALIECIIYLVQSDESFHERYVVGKASWF